MEMACHENGSSGHCPTPTLWCSAGAVRRILSRVLGRWAHDTSGMTVEDIVLNVALGRWTPRSPCGGTILSAAGSGRLDRAVPLSLRRGSRRSAPDRPRATYGDGDYWDRWSVEGFSALRYYPPQSDRWSANTIDVTRTDLYTPQGIRVGASRAEGGRLSPGLTGDYWGQYPEDARPAGLICLWSGHDPEQVSDLSQLEFSQGLGPAISVFLLTGTPWSASSLLLWITRPQGNKGQLSGKIRTSKLGNSCKFSALWPQFHRENIV